MRLCYIHIMRHYTLKDSPQRPVSHDPSLIKRLIAGEGILPGIRGISHIVLPVGSSVESHVHEMGYEVFYCIRGEGVAFVDDGEVPMGEGHCLVVEPGEPHGFKSVSHDMELLYFFLDKPL